MRVEGKTRMIAIDATPLQSEHRFRGVGAYTRHLCNQLITQIPDEICFLATKNGIELLPQNLQAHSLLGWRGHRPAQLYWLYNEVYLRNLLGKLHPKVFHATDFNGTVRLPGIPTVATLHDLTNIRPTKTNSESLSAHLSDWRWQTYYQKKLPQVDHIIAVSRFVKEEAIRHLQIPPSRITVIPHGIDTSLFYPARGQGTFSGRPPYILYVGSRDPNKNVPRALEAFEMVADELEDVHLAIAGRWKAQDHSWLKQRAKGIVRDRIDFLGFVPDTDMASLYSNAEVFLFPSLAEGFGFPIVEAMACGTPVVASNRPPIPEVVGDAALLTDPLDSSFLAKTLVRLLESSDLRETLIVRGLKQSHKYRWDKVAQKTIELYESLVG